MDFTLTIKLGNEAMQTAYDVAGALRKTADKLGDEGGRLGGDVVSGIIRDDNGNTVGRYEVA